MLSSFISQRFTVVAAFVNCIQKAVLLLLSLKHESSSTRRENISVFVDNVVSRDNSTLRLSVE